MAHTTVRATESARARLLSAAVPLYSRAGQRGCQLLSSQALDRVEVRVRAEAIRLRRHFVKLMLIRLECTRQTCEMAACLGRGLLKRIRL